METVLVQKGFSVKIRTSLLIPIFLLLSCIVFTAPAWALAPFFSYCNVKSNTTSQGTNTSITVGINHPSGSVPSIIDSITVEGPGGFTTTLDVDQYDGEMYRTEVAGAPLAGQYTFTVLDKTGESATSGYYLTTVAPLPVVDVSTLKAFGQSVRTLTWSDFPVSSGLTRNHLFQVRVYDDKGKLTWNFPTSSDQATGMTYASAYTTSFGTGTRWSVVALDNAQEEQADNRSESDTIPLTPTGNGPGFYYANVYSGKAGSSTVTIIDSQMLADADDSVSTLVVTGPSGFKYTFPKQTGGSFYYPSPGKPADGWYTFTATSPKGTTVSYHYFQFTTLPLADTSTLRACTEPKGTPSCQDTGNGDCIRITWAAPAGADKPVFYSPNIWDAAGNWVWGSMTENNTCVVPSGKLASGAVYKCTLDVTDLRQPYRPNNLTRTDYVTLVVDNTKPNFYSGVHAAISNDPDGIFTEVTAYVEDPSPGGAGLSPSMSLSVTGPGGLAYTFDPVKDLIADNWGTGYQYRQRFPGIIPDGTFTFTLNYTGGTLVSYDVMHNGVPQIPPADVGAFQVIGDVVAPTISWRALDGYPGHPYYMLAIEDPNGALAYYSTREPYTAVMVPSGALKAGTNYRYRVEACDDPSYLVLNNCSKSPWQNLVLSENTAPGQPEEVEAAPGKGSAAVSFKAPHDGGSPITHYTVTSIPGGVTGTGTQSPIIVPNLTNATAYTFTVTAANTVGTGPASTPSNSVTPSALCLASMAGTWKTNELITGHGEPWWGRTTMTIKNDGTFSGSRTGSDNQTSPLGGTLWRFPHGVWFRDQNSPDPGFLCQMEQKGTVFTCTDTRADGSTDLLVGLKKAASYSLPCLRLS